MNLSQRIGLWILLGVSVIGLTTYSIKPSKNEAIRSKSTKPDQMKANFQNASSNDGFQNVESIVGVTGNGALFYCMKREIKAYLHVDDETFNALWDTKQIYHVHFGHQSDSRLAQTIAYFPYNDEKQNASTLFLFESGAIGEEIQIDDVITDLGIKGNLNTVTSFEEKGDQLKIKNTDGKHSLYKVLAWDGSRFHVINQTYQ